MARRANRLRTIAPTLALGLAFAIHGRVARADSDVSANAPLNYSKWTKACVDDRGSAACLTAREGRNERGQRMISVAVVDIKEKPPVLRILLPLGVQLVHGTRIILDGGTPTQSSYLYCSANGCVSKYELSADFLKRMKTGKSLAVQAINSNGTPLTLPVPLTDLAAAYTGRPADISAIDRSQKAIQGVPSKDYAADPRVVALPAPARENASETPTLRYKPWAKFCLNGKDANGGRVCFTGKGGRIESSLPGLSAIVIEPETELKKIFRITLPLGMQVGPGTFLSIDEDPIAQSPYVICLASGCVSDYDAAGLIGKFKTGQDLLIQAINGDGRDMKFRLPLAGFAKAFEGPPMDPKAFEAMQK
jgi:invasion protein IalB